MRVCTARYTGIDRSVHDPTGLTWVRILCKAKRHLRGNIGESEDPRSHTLAERMLKSWPSMISIFLSLAENTERIPGQNCRAWTWVWPLGIRGPLQKYLRGPDWGILSLRNGPPAGWKFQPRLSKHYLARGGKRRSLFIKLPTLKGSCWSRWLVTSYYTAYSASDNILLRPPDGHLSSLAWLKAPVRITDHNNFDFRA